MRECILVLDSIRSVENTGSIFRTAECLGVKRIVLCGTTPAPTDRFGRKRSDFAKVALGAEETLEWSHEKDIKPALEMLRAGGYEIVVLEQAKDGADLKNFQAPDKFALVAGNEVEGVSKEALRLADHVVEIAMEGEKESLNVSVATGIALYELLK